MQWNSVQDFLHMGGYGLYVWGSFGTTFAVVLLEVILARRQRRQVLNHLRNELQNTEEMQ